MLRTAFPAKVLVWRIRQQYRVIFERGAAEQVEPWVWLTDVLEHIISGRIKAHELERLLPWAWKAELLAATVHA